ncbi:MAG: hypothetical protein IJ433_09200 [Ruminococcus sp.]|nr:hypothetical protein [Ruminococcus sp.]
MKRLISLLMAIFLVLSLCSCTGESEKTTAKNTQETADTGYMAITEIDHCVVEPDDELHMTTEDKMHYRALMDAMLNRKKSVTLSQSAEKNEYYVDLLKQSPYYFFLSKCELNGDKAELTYAYSKTEQSEMLKFIDDSFLQIVNTNATKNDNTLDKILNVHGAVARAMTYDHDRKDNKQLGSPLFEYPSDEIYKALKNKKSVCYGFAYTLRFALLQLDIDCFCVYGPCSGRGEGHMWNIFKFEDKFYTCDSAWDRADDGYAGLFHFGKSDKERKADTLTRTAFSSTFFDEYGDVECTDETFKIFRGISRYTFVNTHTYYMEDYESNEYIFDSETMELK